MSAPRVPNLPRLALEYWRNSGPRTDARLYSLAEHVAGQYGRDAGEVYRAALALTYEGEVQP